MGEARRPPSGFFTLSRPEWQQRLPRKLRIAAEWQFGTWFATSFLLLLRGELMGAAIGVGFSAMVFLMLTGGLQPSWRLETPLGWWAVVVLFTMMGALGVVVLLFGTYE